MKRWTVVCLVAGLLTLGAPEEGAAQEGQDFLDVGETAPDVQVEGATRYGVLAEPVSLSDFRGETVVLAFFFRARTPG
jgi:peroxiredoxin Q/BCP